MDITAYTLFGRARYRVLAALFAISGKQHKDASLHLREIARRAEISPTATQYELRRLLDTGLIVSVGEGRSRGYRANTLHPIYAELRSILRKTDVDVPVKLIEDTVFWRSKRAAQHRDYQSDDGWRKSVFLADPSIAKKARVTFPDDVVYDY